MIKTIEINTMDGVKDFVFEQMYNSDIQRMRSSYFYRGMPDVSYRLISSLARNCKDKASALEMPLLENFIKYVRIEDPTINESIWKAMIIGQHYGLPTRLLDWSHSTLIALHFANTEDNLDNLDKRDCVVWRMDMRDLNSNLPDQYQEVLKKKKTFVFSIDMLSSIVDSIDQYDADMGNNAMVCVEPPSIDQRIANQYSFFSLIPKGITDLEEYLDTHTKNTVRYVIDRKLRWDLRDMLDQFRGNPPVCDRIAEYCQGLFRTTKGGASWIRKLLYGRKKNDRHSKFKLNLNFFSELQRPPAGNRGRIRL